MQFCSNVVIYFGESKSNSVLKARAALWHPSLAKSWNCTCKLVWSWIRTLTLIQKWICSSEFIYLFTYVYHLIFRGLLCFLQKYNISEKLSFKEQLTNIALNFGNMPENKVLVAVVVLSLSSIIQLIWLI